MKRVVITGASRGIGKATAQKFLAEEWVVIATSTAGTGWEQDNLSWVRLDLSNPESIADAVQDITARGSIDVLMNNAGMNDEREDWDGARVIMDALRTTLEINLIGTIDFTERMIPLLAQGGQIIILGSRWGSLSDVSSSGAPSYGISKVGLSMYVRRLAFALPQFTVSICNPGWVQTDMGGDGAERDPSEPARELFELATTPHPSGQFWYMGKPQAW